MDSLAALLSSNVGREKVMRTVQFTCMMLSGKHGKSNLAVKFATVAKQLGGARVVLRLFDDIPTLSSNLAYGTGKQESDSLIRILQVLGNITIQGFFPVEHIAWAAENKLINLNAAPWWSAGIVFWAVSLVLSIIRILLKLKNVNKRLADLANQHRLESPDKSDSDDKQFKQTKRALLVQRRMEILNIIRCSADLMMAVNWLPGGMLWSGKLSQMQSGVFGMISSLIGLFQVIAMRS